MAYIGQSIKNGTFTTLDTSGNTYNGSNTAFALGTQVGSPAQLLVSHDGVIQKPGTDYTLSTGGTAITFTTAPASGASIFIVEISGAVGGPLGSDLNGSELILDADGDTSLHASTDDQIDVKIGGTDVVTLTNSSLVLKGTTPTLTIGDAGAEDTKIVFDGNAQDFHIGLDDTDDSIKIGLGSALGTTAHIISDAAGQVTKPLQAYFHVVPASEQSNIANGNTVVWGSETVDTGGNFASNAFTAPVTGVYLLSVSLNVNQFDSSASYVWVNVVTSNRTHKISIHGEGQDADSYYNLSGTVIADMDASDTVTITWEQSGGAAQADVLASNSHFYGYLLG